MARQLYYAGSVKWLDQPFDRHDTVALQRDAARIPGFDPASTALVAVSRAGYADPDPGPFALRWRPSDIVAAFA